jgi:ParB-like nuclease domain/DNA methylase
MWLGVKLNRTPRRFGQQSAKTLPTRGALQIEDLSVEDLHPYKNDPRIKNKQTNSAVSLPRPELRNLQTLRPYQHNARTHSKRQLEQIGRSIERFGFLNPVLIDASGTIIAGHGRVEAAKQLGLSRVPTLRIEHLSDAEKRAYILADNKLAQKAGWHRETLAIELQALVDMDFEIELTGFEMAEVDFILDEAAEINQAPLLPEDSIPELSAEPPTTKRGDLWLLGAHRLYCGDARDERAYDALMKGTKADFVFTDPPYNVPIDGYVSGLGRIRHREFAMASGEMSQAEYTTFLEKVFRLLCAHTENGSIHDICIDWRHIFEMLVAGRAVYHELKNLCVWNKGNAGMGSFYRSQHELVLIWKNGPQSHTNNFELGQYGAIENEYLELCGRKFIQARANCRTRHAPDGQAGCPRIRCHQGLLAPRWSSPRPIRRQRDRDHCGRAHGPQGARHRNRPGLLRPHRQALAGLHGQASNPRPQRCRIRRP